MKLSELDLVQFMPAWMRDDSTAQGFIYAVQNRLSEIAAGIQTVSLYARIPTMSSELLDELAWGLNIPEYRSEYDVDVKRRLVKTAILTHRMRGTVAAVEKVVSDIFGDGYVEEWFDYDGSPFHFKVHTSYIGAVDQDAAAFDHAVMSAKNLRSILDEIVVEAAIQTSLFAAGVLHVRDAIYIN